MGSPTEFWTLSTSEWNHTLAPSLKDEGVSSLSDILMAIGDVPQEYYLSPKACLGILRRAVKRKKRLPDSLAIALASVASLEKPTAAKELLTTLLQLSTTEEADPEEQTLPRRADSSPKSADLWEQ